MFKTIFKCMLVCIIFLSNGLQVLAEEKETVTIAMRNNALNTAIKFLSAQKKCQTEEMITFSINLQRIKDLNDHYQNRCKIHPLQKADITDFIVVSSELALVSTKLDYADKVMIQTEPIIKKEGKWKLVQGLHQSLESVTNRAESNNSEVIQAINEYFTSIKRGDTQKKEKLEKKLTKEDNLIKFISTKSLNYKVNNINRISETVAVASITIFVDPYHTIEKKYIMYKEDQNWKLIVDRDLVKASIPKNANPVEVK